MFWEELKELEDFDDVQRRYLESLPVEKRLAGLTPEQLSQALPGEIEQRFVNSLPIEKRIQGLTPEQLAQALPVEKRLAGLTPEQLVEALSDDVLTEILRRRKHP